MSKKQHIGIVCPCGDTFMVPPCHSTGRKKYCSKKCFYKYRGRMKGLKYLIVQKNKGWFETGELFLNQLHKTNMNKYKRLHFWINKIKKKTGICKKCKNKKKTQFVNISRKCKKILSDWTELCCSCHKQYDFHRKEASWLSLL